MDDQTVRPPTIANATAPAPHWLHSHLGTTMPAAPAAQPCLTAVRQVARTLDADPAWRRWWSRSGQTSCELGIVAENGPEQLRPGADLSTAGGHLRATFTCAIPAAGTTGLLPWATAEIIAMLDVIREALALGPLPTLPPMPALPLDLDIRITTRPQPSGLDGQSPLSLAQIQEFFELPPPSDEAAAGRRAP